MKLKNIAVGDIVQVKKSMCHSEFEAKQLCQVIDIDPIDNFGFDVLIQGKNDLDWVNHKDLKKPEPQPKQLDQSIFDGLDEKWRFAAIGGRTGRAYVYEQKPLPLHRKGYWCIHEGLHRIVGEGYDESNWQNSLIERDVAEEPLEVDLSSGLTGSDLCRAMIIRGDKVVLCIVGDYEHEDDTYYDAITYCRGDYFESTLSSWRYATPINNQGEPLTASEVGL